MKVVSRFLVQGETKIIMLSVFVGVIIWVVDFVVDTLAQQGVCSFSIHEMIQSPLDILVRSIISLVVVIFGLIVAKAYAVRRKMSDEMSASNQQLRAVTQQMKATEQQLRATNQQLSATEQQLRAAILQLRSYAGELEDEKEKVKRYLDVAGVIMLVLDADANVAMINRKGCEITGVPHDQIVGKNWIKNFLPKRLVEEVVSVFESIVKGSRDFVEYYENPLVDSAGNERIVAWHNVPLTDEKGKISGVLSSGADITELRKSERRSRDLMERLVRAEKMESLGFLAGGVAHDLNNILTPVTALPEVILEELDRLQTKSDLSQIKEDISAIRDSGKTACGVIRDLLTLSRRGHYKLEPVDVGKIVQSYIKAPVFRAMLGQNPAVVLDLEVSTNLKAILGSEPHLIQIIMNLTTNAIEAMPHGGTLIVTVEEEYVEKQTNMFEPIDEGEYVTIRVKDSGVGIKSEDLLRIFEPFYSKKKMGARSGSGLGLAVVYGVIKDHGGCVDVRSEVGLGAEFIVYLPVTEEQPIERKDSTIRGGEESILVVDDIERQRQLCSRLLQGLGYKTASVGKAAEAIGVFAKAHNANKPSPFELVVLDMILEEEMDGLDVYREVRKFYPDQRCIIVSGFSETERVVKAREIGAGRLVSKPYSLKDLADAVRKELDRGK